MAAIATRIGCDNLVYAIMTAEDTATTAPTYATPVSLIGVQTINLNPNATQDTNFADDGPMIVSSTLGNIEVQIQKAFLTAEDKAALLGHVKDTKGGLAYGSDDTPPWVAIGYRTLKSNGHYRYVWLYKGKFVDPEDNSETKQNSINYQNETINAQFARLNNTYTIDSVARRVWKYEIDEDTESVDAPTIAAWFTSVTMPTADV